MALFGGFQERREKKAVEHYLGAASIGSIEIEALRQACPQAATVLHDLLTKSSDRDKRFRALLGLQSLGVTRDMVPAVIGALRDEDDLVQEAAGKILAGCRQHVDLVLPALVADYREVPSSRPVILELLSAFGSEAHGAAGVLVDGLDRPLEALAIARCLARIGAQDLEPAQRAMVEILNDKRSADDLKALGPAFAARLEAFLLSCVPWRAVDAIPAWRRVLEAYAESGERPGDALLALLQELAQYSDWKLRGEVGPQFLEMSRAKAAAEKLVSR